MRHFRYFQTLLDFLDKIVDLRTVCYWKLTYLKKSLEQGTKFLHVQVGNIHLFSSLSNPNTSGRSLESVCQSSKFATRLTPHWILKKRKENFKIFCAKCNFILNALTQCLKITKKSHSSLRAKRATFTFQKFIRIAKNSNLASFWKPEAWSQTKLPDRSVLKMMKMPKSKDSNTTFWVETKENGSFWRDFENLKFAVKQRYQKD